MYRFKVSGMSCGHCVRSVKDAVGAQDPAARVEVDLAGGQVTVVSTLANEQIARAIEAAGYPTTSI